jgi:hypothetical protein
MSSQARVNQLGLSPTAKPLDHEVPDLAVASEAAATVAHAREESRSTHDGTFLRCQFEHWRAQEGRSGIIAGTRDVNTSACRWRDEVFLTGIMAGWSSEATEDPDDTLVLNGRVVGADVLSPVMAFRNSLEAYLYSMVEQMVRQIDGDIETDLHLSQR